jgi:enoyl-[acyl-carrier protein] reductase II
VKQAKKAEEAGCDAVVAEGFEAGGHNGVDEITTMCLVPQVVDAVNIPVIAAGGIADGRAMLAAMSLGAEAVQVGTRFAATFESSAHEMYKQKVVEAQDNSTILTLKQIAPVRLIKNDFAKRAVEAEKRGATKEEQLELLASKRERAGIFEGDFVEGEFEAGQSSGLVQDIIPAGEVIKRMMNEYEFALDRINSRLINQ